MSDSSARPPPTYTLIFLWVLRPIEIIAHQQLPDFLYFRHRIVKKKKKKELYWLGNIGLNWKPFIPEYQPWFLHVQQNSTNTSGLVEYMENHIKSKNRAHISKHNKPRSRQVTPSEVCGTVVWIAQHKALRGLHVRAFHNALHKGALAIRHEGSHLIPAALGLPCLLAFLLAYVIKMTPALQQLHIGSQWHVIIHYLLGVFLKRNRCCT